jgi:hypothetical protein
MIEDSNEYLVGIVLGIRFNPNFSVRDNLGAIADEILYGKDTIFGPNVFQKVMSTENFQQILVSEETNDQFRINNLDFILEINFKDNPNFSIENIDHVIQKFHSQIINGVMDKFFIKNIRRVGYVKKFLIDQEDIAEKLISKTISNIENGISDCNISFSKKIPLSESLTKKELNDYDNVNYSFIKKPDLKELNINFDFQSHFEPPLPKSNNIKFPQFIQKSNDYFNKHFIPLVNEKILGE